MAGSCPVAPLFVGVAQAGRATERLDKKLQLYFQSRRSGGGECDVQVHDLQRGVYRVSFQSEEAKRRVQASKHHFIKCHDQPLKICILQDSEATDSAAKSFSASLTSQATSPLSTLSTKQSQYTFEKMQLNEYTDNPPATITKESLTSQYTSPPSISSTQQSQNGFEKFQPREKYVDNPPIFLHVSATLNTDLFTREERDKLVHLWPTLKIEKCSSQFGVERVAGDYGDVEKLHHYLETLFAESRGCDETEHPQKQNDLEEMTVDNHGRGNDTEEFSNMEVPSAVFEYFSYVCKREMEDLEERFSIKVTSAEDGSGMTAVKFASAGSSSCIEKAQQAFVTAFQNVAADVKQEVISLTDIHQVTKMSEMLSTSFKSILVKSQGNILTIRGPARDLSAAKELMKNTEAESSTQTPEVHFPQTDFVVDSDLFELLEPKLATEIQFIKQTYGMLMEKRKCSKKQNIHVIFKPETKKKTPYVTSEADKTFFRAYQKALKTEMEKAIPLKLSLDLREKVNEFFISLQTENPRVELRQMEGTLMIRGFPEHVLSAEKHILHFLSTCLPAPPAGALPSIHTAKTGTSSGTSLGHNSGQKEHSFPSGKPSSRKAANAEPEVEECTICMDKINQKEVLPKCKHAFCRSCIQAALKYKPACPVCNMAYGKIEGNQPRGKMDISKTRASLPGYQGSGTITITYHIPDGIQQENHPNPGRKFQGTMRTAYLPDNKEGREILQLLQRAFDQKLIFTVGQSRTTGMTDVVTWNDIHHKTSIYGGTNGFGYPDPNYLKRVREELKVKGIE